MKQQRITDYSDNDQEEKSEDTFPLEMYNEPCPRCGSVISINKKGKRKRKNRDDVQRFYCLKCKKRFTPSSYPSGHYPPWVWNQILDLYVKGLHAKAIAEEIKKIAKLTGKPLAISKNTVLNNIIKSSHLLTKFEMKLDHKIKSDEWQIDDCYQRLNKKLIKKLNKSPNKPIFGYVTNVLEVKTRFWLVAHVSMERDEKASKEAIRLAISRAKYQPKEVKCDGHQPCINSVKALLPHTNINPKSKDKDFSWINFIERLNETMRDGALPKRKRFNSVELLCASADINRLYYNYLRPHMSLNGKTPAYAVGIKFPFRNWGDIFTFAYSFNKQKL